MTSSDRPGAPAPGPPSTPVPGSTTGSASAGSTTPAGSPAVVTPAGSSAVGTATEFISTSDYGGSFGGPPLAAPPTTAPKRPAPAPVVASPVRLGARRARLTIRRLDPWSVLKFTLLFSVCMLIVGVVAVWALYYALDKLEVFTSIHNFVLRLTESGGVQSDAKTGGIDISFKAKWFIGGAAVLGAINTVIFTALATLGAFLYNLCSDIVGGIEVVLGERD